MALRHRSGLTVLVVLVLAAFVLLGRWYALRRAAPVLTPTTFTATVTASADRGPGSLREALFAADTAASPADVLIKVNSITLQSSLPPLVNPHGIRILAPPTGVQIDARAVHDATPIFDVDAAHASIDGVSIQGCTGTAILIRAARFRLTNSTLQSCDVGVEVAANASDVALERNQFRANHIGVRFTAPSADTLVVKNQFANNSTAGIWVVASQPQVGPDAISVRDNQFSADATDVVLGNVPVLLEHNDFSAVQEAAVHIIGTGAAVRNNHISNGSAAGILVENAHGAVVEGNELDHLKGYGILLRGSSDTLVRANRIQSCGYGMAFVLGDEHHPNSAVDNTMIDLNYDGVDVIGESPILRRNQVLQARVVPLHVQNFSAPDGSVVRAQPLLEANRFELAAVTGADHAAR